METYIQSTIAIIAVINPVVCATMLLDLGSDKAIKIKLTEAVRVMGTVLVILLVAALAGKYILHVFGISMDAFRIVGGLVLAFIGFQMLGGSKNKTIKSQSGDMTKVVLFAASPGSITMVVTLAAVHDKEGFPVNAIVGIVSAVVLSIITISIIEMISTKKKAGGQGMLSKFMGLIIISMGMQFLLDGIKNFFEV
jgi:multiple antibiotic resistance protein